MPCRNGGLHTERCGGAAIPAEIHPIVELEQPDWCVVLLFPPPACAGIHPTLHLFGFGLLPSIPRKEVGEGGRAGSGRRVAGDMGKTGEGGWQQGPVHLPQCTGWGLRTRGDQLM